MNSRIGLLSSTNLIILDGTIEEDDAPMVTYSYLLHTTMIYDSSKCVGSNVKCLWSNAKLPYSWNLLPPTHILLKMTSSGFLLHSIVETKYHIMGGASSPS